jgi:hypothetical protein
MSSRPSDASGDETSAETQADPGAPEQTDDLRRQFREALDRKHGHGSVGDVKGGESGGKPHHASGPAKAQRTFRRKSGG